MHVPRPSWKYRAAKRNYDKRNWEGVRADVVVEHPPLVKVVSKKGEISYRQAKESIRKGHTPAIETLKGEFRI